MFIQLTASMMLIFLFGNFLLVQKSSENAGGRSKRFKNDSETCYPERKMPFQVTVEFGSSPEILEMEPLTETFQFIINTIAELLTMVGDALIALVTFFVDLVAAVVLFDLRLVSTLQGAASAIKEAVKLVILVAAEILRALLVTGLTFVAATIAGLVTLIESMGIGEQDISLDVRLEQGLMVEMSLGKVHVGLSLTVIEQHDSILDLDLPHLNPTLVFVPSIATGEGNAVTFIQGLVNPWKFTWNNASVVVSADH